MRKMISLLTALTLIHVAAYSISADDRPPAEMIILKLPNSADWKVINWQVNANEAIVERIPLNQTCANWSELINMQYFDIVTLKLKNMSVEAIMVRFHDGVMAAT
jgi:hypothetical protein